MSTTAPPSRNGSHFLDQGNEQPNPLSPEMEDAIQGALLRFTTNYREFVDEAGFAGLLSHWEKAAEDHADWLTPDLIDQGLNWTLYREPPTMQGGTLAYRSKTPPVAVFLDACRRFRRDAEDRAQSKRVLSLPAPKGDRPGNAELLRHIAIGKLRARHGRLLERGDPAPQEFGDGEINAVLAEMAQRREYESLRRLREEASSLDTLAAMGAMGAVGAVEAASAAGEWPQPAARHGTNGGTR
jgi:hypothetical protein